jgi:hypothetical protein
MELRLFAGMMGLVLFALSLLVGGLAGAALSFVAGLGVGQAVSKLTDERQTLR